MTKEEWFKNLDELVKEMANEDIRVRAEWVFNVSQQKLYDGGEIGKCFGYSEIMDVAMYIITGDSKYLINLWLDDYEEFND